MYDLPGLADGDWAIWPAQDMLDRIPAEIQAELGHVKNSVITGPFLALAFL